MIRPAPLWRRLAAALYDGLLLLGLWMAALLVDTIARDGLGSERQWPALRAYLFLIGLAFFGWFWTHGGQTLGMRAWRLQLRRTSGADVRWTEAALRYALMLLCWGVALTPAAMTMPALAARPQAHTLTAATVIATALALLLLRLDPRRRGPQDWLSGTEVVYLGDPQPAVRA